MTSTPTLLDALVDRLQQTSKVNEAVQAKPSAVLWPDAGSEWRSAYGELRQRLPGLVAWGDYQPDIAQGPAIWLKCAVARTLPAFAGVEGPIIVYLPGVSRTDLRAIESCPRALQPLAELQYRGVIWSQANNRDWTPAALLGSENGGLGLNVAKDRATQEALANALQSGVLLNIKLADLQGREINAEWLEDLLQPNPVRELLVWMHKGEAGQAEMGAVAWKVFAKRCKADFGFDAQKDGPVVAAEKLAAGGGRWDSVWQAYCEAYRSFPGVTRLLEGLAPPPADLFEDPQAGARYPTRNADAESALRATLMGCAAQTDREVRDKLRAAELEHGHRRAWLWADMERAPLARSLEPLLHLADATSKLPVGDTPSALGSAYAEQHWQADAAALRALASVSSRADTDAVGAAVRALYQPWLEATAQRFQAAVRAAGVLGQRPSSPRAEAGCCTVFVDGLRYDVAQTLAINLSGLGETKVEWTWTSRPSVTASGKAWCSPVAHLISGVAEDVDFQPRVAADGRELSTQALRKLISDNGVQVLDAQSTGDPSGAAWVECGDLDHFGHQHGLRLARDLDEQLSQITERLGELVAAGWRRLRIVTDHGWLLLPGGLPKAELAKHQAETRWGRCAVLKESAHATELTMGWDWCEQVQIAYAPGVSNFRAGEDYAHGGLTLQECLVPVIELSIGGAPASQGARITSLTWKGLRCLVEVEGGSADVSVDIRQRVADAASSLSNSVRNCESGRASLAVVDDGMMGEPAAVVLLGSGGEVIQKMSTTVGGGD